MFYLSSPPQPPPQPQFFNNPFGFSYPTSIPSPLRTSYNANGVKRSRMYEQNPPSDGAHSLSSPLSKRNHGKIFEDSENETENTAIFSPPTTLSSADGKSACTPATTSSLTTPSTTASTFTFTPPATTSASSFSSTPFAFAARARAASPANLLASHASTAKAQNKQRFRDRLRARRDEGLGRDDKVLRADYLGERRAWEEEMARRAAMEGEGGVVVDDEEEEEEQADKEAEGGGGGRESPIEEREIEALVALMEHEDGGDAESGAAHEAMDAGSDGDGSEWDEVFMEVLSQQETQLQSSTSSERVVPGADGGGMDVEMS